MTYAVLNLLYHRVTLDDDMPIAQHCCSSSTTQSQLGPGTAAYCWPLVPSGTDSYYYTALYYTMAQSRKPLQQTQTAADMR